MGVGRNYWNGCCTATERPTRVEAGGKGYQTPKRAERESLKWDSSYRPCHESICLARRNDCHKVKDKKLRLTEKHTSRMMLQNSPMCERWPEAEGTK